MNKPTELYVVIRKDPFPGELSIMNDYRGEPSVTDDISKAENLRDTLQTKFPWNDYRIYKIDEVIGSAKP